MHYLFDRERHSGLVEHDGLPGLVIILLLLPVFLIVVIALEKQYDDYGGIWTVTNIDSI